MSLTFFNAKYHELNSFLKSHTFVFVINWSDQEIDLSEALIVYAQAVEDGESIEDAMSQEFPDTWEEIEVITIDLSPEEHIPALIHNHLKNMSTATPFLKAYLEGEPIEWNNMQA